LENIKKGEAFLPKQIFIDCDLIYLADEQRNKL